MNKMKKQEIREEIKDKKWEIFTDNDQVYYNFSAKMVYNVLQFPQHISSNVIALFASKKASFEIYTDSLITRSINSGKKVYLPRCITKTHDLEYLHVTDLIQDLEIGTFSLREPKNTIKPEEQKIIYQNFDLVYVPGVAFDLFGNRLGFGSGYYDKFLKTLRNYRTDIPVIGLAFDFQVFNNEIPHNAKDEKVDYIITSSAIFKTNI